MTDMCTGTEFGHLGDPVLTRDDPVLIRCDPDKEMALETADRRDTGK